MKVHNCVNDLVNKEHAWEISKSRELAMTLFVVCTNSFLSDKNYIPVAILEVWQEWQSCSVTCDEGLQLRERACIQGTCVRDLKESKLCNLIICRMCFYLYSMINFFILAILSAWQSWQSCSATCNEGTQLRARTCTQGTCVGDLNELKACTIKVCTYNLNYTYQDCH